MAQQAESSDDPLTAFVSFGWHQAGRIVLGGRYGQFRLVLVKAETEDAARELFKDDPAMASGVFKAEFDRWSTFYGWQAP